MTASNTLSRRTLVFYALPGFALAVPTIPVYVYLPTFYAEFLGLGLAVTGATLLIARLFDVITDPLIGTLSDRFQFPWGRRKPWIIAGALLAGLGLVQLLMPSSNPEPSYLLTWAIVLYLGWTMVAVPFTAWGAELSRDYHERARITGAREGAMILGILIAGGLPAAASAMGRSESDGLAAAAWLAIAIGLPTIALLVWLVPDQGQLPSSQLKQPIQPLKALHSIIKNGPFVRLLSGWFVNGLANGFPAVLFPLYLQYCLEADATMRGIFIGVYFLAGVIAIPAWVSLSRRFGKHRIWCASMLMACLTFIWVPLLSPGDFVLFFIVCIITGFALGADLSLPPAMQADVIDFDALKTGQNRAGTFFALWSMGTKFALAGAVGIAFPLLSWLGFQTGINNTPEALLALAVIYAFIPTVLKVGAIMLIWGHPITAKRQQIIRRRLDRRDRLNTSGTHG